MTQIEELEDAVLELEAKLHGKRLEPKPAEPKSAQDGCYFTEAGEADRKKMLEAAC